MFMLPGAYVAADAAASAAEAGARETPCSCLCPPTPRPALPCGTPGGPTIAGPENKGEALVEVCGI